MATEGQAGSHAKVVRAIVQHLLRHPDAKDTVEGILAWWLPAGGVGFTTEDVQQATAALSDQGWLEVRDFGPSRTVYGLKRARRAELPGLLRHGGDDDA